jgi:succinate-semialdehyde dehydrogenase/glutarate-semialdehyde dehydrogenase
MRERRGFHAANLMKQYELLINGQYLPAQSGEYFSVVNPATGETVATCAQAGVSDTQAALQAAHDAFPSWSRTSGRSRSDIMHAAAAIFRSRISELSRLLTAEQGKPVKDSNKELQFTADVIDYYAEEARRNFGLHFEGDGAPTHSFTMRQPIGVVAAITPWNFPVDLLSWKVGPALAAGCTMVIKPPSEAPLAVSEFIRCFVEAGLPAGVLNLVMGPGRPVGSEMVTNPLSRKIAFTGSTNTGLWIAQEAAKQLKPVTLELGGSAPFVIFKDADLDLAVSQALRRAFSHAGQICISVNRIFVQENLSRKFIEKFTAAARALRVANGLEVPDADLGPMISESGRQTVREHVSDAIEKGARVLTGGHEPEGAQFSKGYFYLPTVLVDVTPTMRIMQEETFGPVAPIATFKTVDEGIDMANNSPYGLAAYIFTNDLNTAMYSAERIQSGGVGININDITDIRAPFGGMKQSGMGRELGQQGLDSYTEWKHVRVLMKKPE